MVTSSDEKGKTLTIKVKNQQIARKRDNSGSKGIYTFFTVIIIAIVSMFIVVIVIAPPGIMDDQTNTTNPTQTSSGASQEFPSPVWIYNMSDGLALAAAENKPLMVDFYAEWCYWCKELDKNVYSNQWVIEASQDFINVRLDTEVEQWVIDEYGVYWLPMILFMDADENVLVRVDVYVPTNDFLAYMNQALQEFQS